MRENTPVNRFFKNIRLLLAACLLAACSPARTGVLGNTLTTNVKPPISITGQGTLVVKAHGTLRPDTATDSLTVRESVAFNYAFYADGSPPADAPSNRFAYAVIARVSNTKLWRFQPPEKMNGAFSEQTVVLNGIGFSEQLLRVSSEKDWGSGVWRENGRPVPDYWLAKRWVTHLDEGTRAVMEYREEWPDAMSYVSAEMIVLGGSAGEALSAFIKRADAAFLAEKKAGDFNQAETPPSVYRVPQKDPDVARLVGEVIPTGVGR